jgi:calcium and integrin-binding protein 2
MGSAKSKLAEADMELFESRTFFTRSEIDRLYDRFEELGGSLQEDVEADEILKLPELKMNPFRIRIGRVFGLVDEDSGKHMFSFEAFLQMFNAFSPRASLDIKAYWAFKIYGMLTDLTHRLCMGWIGLDWILSNADFH